MNDKLIEIFKKYQEKENINTVTLAENFGVKPASLYRFYKGENEPSFVLLGGAVKYFAEKENAKILWGILLYTMGRLGFPQSFLNRLTLAE